MIKINNYVPAVTSLIQPVLLLTTGLFSLTVNAHPGHAGEHDPGLWVILLATVFVVVAAGCLRRKQVSNLRITGEQYVPSHSHANHGD